MELTDDWNRRHVGAIVQHIDEIVQRWNGENPQYHVSIERGGSELYGEEPLRMYRRLDRIAALRFFPPGTEFPQLRQGVIVLGGTFGSSIAQTCLNLILIRVRDTQRGVWQLVDVSETPCPAGLAH